MFQPFLNFINDTVNDLSFKRLIVIAFIAISALSSLVFYETYTDSLHLSKSEKIVNLVKIMSELPSELINKEDIANLTKLAAEHIKEVFPQANSVGAGNSSIASMPEWVKKIFFILIPWAFVGITILLGEKDKAETLIGLMLISAISCVIGFLPFDWWQSFIWPNYWVYPSVHFSIIFIVLLVFSRNDP